MKSAINLFSLVFLVSCSNSTSMSGKATALEAAKKKAGSDPVITGSENSDGNKVSSVSPTPTSEIVSATPGTDPTTVATVVVSPTTEPTVIAKETTTVTPSIGPTLGACTINLTYDPSDIKCQLNVKGPNIWTSTGGWNTLAAAFPDRNANWISSLNSTGDGAYEMCPHVPANEKLVYVSYFNVASASTFIIDAVVDNTGTFSLWKNADPNQKVVSFAVNPSAHKEVNLYPGFYSIIAEGTDFGSASAIIYSIRDTIKDAVVKRTELGIDYWCIFRVSSLTKLDTFIPEAAKCRKCFVGD